MFRIILLIFLFFSVSVTAQDFKISINKLTEETQQLSESPDNLKLVWWIPVEFWEAVFKDDKTIPDEQADEMLEIFSQYTILATLDGKIGSFGDVTYSSKEKVFEALEILDTNRNSYKPLPESSIDEKTQGILAFMKPVLSNMLGKLGDNMHFFLFQKEGNPFDRIVNPKLEGSFTVRLTNEDFHWKLPLSSLVRPKKCPVDKEIMNGTWKYCPIHGKELVLLKSL